MGILPKDISEKGQQQHQQHPHDENLLQTAADAAESLALLVREEREGQQHGSDTNIVIGIVPEQTASSSINISEQHLAKQQDANGVGLVRGEDPRQERFLNAVTEGNTSLVESLLASAAATEGNNTTATGESDDSTNQSLLSFQDWEDNGRTALHKACSYGHLDIVSLLTKRGGRTAVQALDQEGYPPHFVACDEEHLDILQYLFETFAIDVNQPYGLFSETLLHRVQDRDTCQWLLDRPNVQLEVVTVEGKTPLHTAQTEAVVELLLERGAKVSARDHQGNTPLLDKCRGSGDLSDHQHHHHHHHNRQQQSGGNNNNNNAQNENEFPAMIRRLVQAGASLQDERNHLGETAWHNAVLFGDTAVVQLLLEEYPAACGGGSASSPTSALVGPTGATITKQGDDDDDDEDAVVVLTPLVVE